jgi:hypothetical protein
MKWILRILILVAVLALIVVGITVVRLAIGDGPPTCVVRFDGTTYPDAVRINDSLASKGYSVDLQGRKGGSSLAVVLTVKDDDVFFYSGASDLRKTISRELTHGDGGTIESCEDGKLG